MSNDDFLTLAVDPGEDTGWSLWHDTRLLTGGTTKMWDFADNVWLTVTTNRLPASVLDPHLRENVYQRVERIVCEDFRIYPHKAVDLIGDQIRTARLIGALYFIARLQDVEFVLQPAKIKERAIAGGAEELFRRPLHENRHQNDSIMHGLYYFQTQAGPQSIAAEFEGGLGGPGGK